MSNTKLVLVVDDEPELREVIRYLLEDANYRVIEAVDGQDGLQKALAEKPDLILSDVMMPKMDGLQMLAEIKSQLNCPVVMISGFADVKKIRTAWHLGAFDFVDKPFKSNELLEIVNRALVFSPTNK
jgi:DNA-binding NtrC family response regulator